MIQTTANIGDMTWIKEQLLRQHYWWPETVPSTNFN